MWKYCESCNQNFITENEKKSKCPTCGWLSNSPCIDDNEKIHRDKIYKGYCNKCGEILYTVPIQTAIDIVKNNYLIDNKINILVYCAYFTYFIICILLSHYYITLSLIILFIILIHYIITKNSKKISKLQYKSLLLKLEKQTLTSLYICSNCFNSISLTKNNLREIKIIQNNDNNISNKTILLQSCPYCSHFLSNNEKICQNCGTNIYR